MGYEGWFRNSFVTGIASSDPCEPQYGGAAAAVAVAAATINDEGSALRKGDGEGLLCPAK